MDNQEFFLTTFLGNDNIGELALRAEVEHLESQLRLKRARVEKLIAERRSSESS